MTQKSYQNEARRVLHDESKAIAGLIDQIDDDFDTALEIIARCEGRVIVTGMGKSGLIGKKIAATLASTGTPSVFLHAAEGLHGDLGVISPADVVIAISYSGETDELLSLFPFFREFDVPVIAITGSADSTLGANSRAVLRIAVEKEACPLGITPTSSSTATLAMGDALAMALITMRGFRKEDFARRHPGGSLGKQLLLKVSDLMHTGDQIPGVCESESLQSALLEISAKRLGFTTVLDAQGVLQGIITDGDLRRIFEAGNTDVSVRVDTVMTRSPKTIAGDVMALDALKIMEEYQITALLVVDAENRPRGAVHIHDILGLGLK